MRLEAGKRAMALRVDEIIGVSGFIVPDDRVDVIVTTTPPGSKNQDDKISKIVLQNKRVLSVAQSVEQKDGKPQVARSITVEVTPEESEKLSLATQDGQLVLALRSIGDDVDAKTAGSNKRDLLAVAAQSVREEPAVAPRRRTNIGWKCFTAVTEKWWNSKWKGSIHETAQSYVDQGEWFLSRQFCFHSSGCL
jgi:pilus assembly protein CpaB